MAFLMPLMLFYSLLDASGGNPTMKKICFQKKRLISVIFGE